MAKERAVEVVDDGERSCQLSPKAVAVKLNQQVDIVRIQSTTAMDKVECGHTMRTTIYERQLLTASQTNSWTPYRSALFVEVLDKIPKALC